MVMDMVINTVLATLSFAFAMLAFVHFLISFKELHAERMQYDFSFTIVLATISFVFFYVLTHLGG